MNFVVIKGARNKHDPGKCPTIMSAMFLLDYLDKCLLRKIADNNQTSIRQENYAKGFFVIFNRLKTVLRLFKFCRRLNKHCKGFSYFLILCYLLLIGITNFPYNFL